MVNKMPSDHQNDGPVNVAHNLTLMSNFESWQRRILVDLTPEGRECMISFWNLPTPKYKHCNATWDNYYCWPVTEANKTVYNPCPFVFAHDNDVQRYGHRFCNADGQWAHGNWTNYTACLDQDLINKFYGPTSPTQLVDESELMTAIVLRDIYFYGSIVSLLLLMITWVIFQFFKSLQCSRISVHKNLVVSFIIRYLIVFVMFEPYITSADDLDTKGTYRQVEWLCKLIQALLQYSVMANIFWMFVEGLFLHNRIAISVFSTETPFLLYYFIGWGLPGLFVMVWAICMKFKHPDKCWDNYAGHPLFWIIAAPSIAAIVINLFFLIKIICILVTKLTANNTVETNQVRKALKAILVLFPLLGITYLLYVLPSNDKISKAAYHIVNAILQSSQGIFVSIIYCFLNGEVQAAIKKKWQRYQLQKFGSVRGKRRTSRTSSFFLSQTENSNTQQNKLLSNGGCCENGMTRLQKINSDHKLLNVEPCIKEKEMLEAL
ncbi:corticotropin-releasing factor receptor 2-like [Lingula anatina]|uniref:Corticotropin-releasing factor receptor 2-like n=1 Tax=Lingula anatina TaxID=7574 RepID=A0A1S3K882_LINAN|nr:corticotropin-releasing factor receptor 2-like [Lingula anatina]XP_013418467.1 corticotropin-releasing factor receptor 2-like [Lingula anatina]XP_013418468.1 corticotropin-releasing factor receptor 2-like [Lingula anatina]XP_013418469.1 corticotropin-releasing factor receptor 2-like [Lingula anatina]XP_013418470.1 corticotropin-releasing factor receptor 2-like [Lingula anatina]XP_013418471.1 corticotropin-releasing factor receptor 2-like [Lingula anatina]XP_013418473.1 corticotropin-releas|eukprot:XP_013418466.1 corticotropin-releasing factor receptor 2-like [Lingula anatina]